MITFIYYNFLYGVFTQIFYWLFFFSRLAFKSVSNKQQPSKEQRPVSVVICAKNEAENLQQFLPLILNQKYTVFEVVVVNDRSTDDTQLILETFQKQYTHLKVIQLNGDEERTSKGKKFALSEGIKATQYDILLLTDADCKPNNEYWIDYMQQHLDDKIQIGLGYGPLNQKKYTDSFWRQVLNRVSRFETTQTSMQYFSAALIGLPYMGVGRNIIYYKSLFDKVDGFKNHSHIASGDDDLFINEVANNQNTTIILEPKTFVYSDAKEDWQDFYTQKTRHVSTSIYYKLKHQIYLGLFYSSLLAFHLYSSLMLIFGIELETWLILFVTRTLIMYGVSYQIFKKLQVTDLWLAVPILDFVYLLYLMRMLPATINRNTTRWK